MPALSTWQVLQDFGFIPHASVISDVTPGLYYHFGCLRLEAGVMMNLRFAQVISLSGVFKSRDTVAEVHFELPLRIDSMTQCAAWLAWHLDKAVGGRLEPFQLVEWLEIGRTNHALLPWLIEDAAYRARPQCIVERDWARALLNTLKAAITRVSDDTMVWFSFDGEVLLVRCGSEVVASAASGKAWSERFGLTANRLNDLPPRFKRSEVTFSVWDGTLYISNWRYDGVTTEGIVR